MRGIAFYLSLLLLSNITVIFVQSGFLDALKRELNVPEVAGSDYSLASDNNQDTFEQKVSTLAISSLLEKKKGTEEVLKTCCPASLLEWLIKNNIDSPYKESDMNGCSVKVPELKDAKSASKLAKWDDLDNLLKGDSDDFKRFPKVLKGRFPKKKINGIFH